MKKAKQKVAAKNSDLSASLEDYLEAIFNLADQANHAHSKDIAATLDVSKASVTGALQVLKEKGLINYRPYGSITLTKAGQAAAAEVVKKHNVLKSFFAKVLGVKKDIAQQAACRAEHILGPEVIARLLAFIDFVTQENKDGYDLANKFKGFCKKRARKTYSQPGRKSGK